MKQSLAKLVNVVLQRLEDRTDNPLSEKGVRTWLAGQGYKKCEIDAVIKLVRPKLRTFPLVPVRNPGAVRHLSTYEAHKLTPEARDALARLDVYELIDPYEREILMERLGQLESDVGLEDLDYLLSWILYTTRDVESQQTIYSVLEGGTRTLH